MAEHTVDAAQEHPDDSLSHVMSPKVLLAVWAALSVLTVVTVAVSYLQLGDWDIWVAVGIATFKTLLVALFFMHLLYDRRLHLIVVLTGLGFVYLFIAGVLTDRGQYDEWIRAYRESKAPIETPAPTPESEQLPAPE